MGKVVLILMLALGSIGGVGHWLLSSNAKIEDSARDLLSSPDFKDSMTKIVSNQNSNSPHSAAQESATFGASDIARAAASLGNPDERDQLLKIYFRDPSLVLNQLTALARDPNHQREVLETAQFIETTGVTPETQGAVLTILEQIIENSTQPGLREYAASLRDARLQEMSGDDREPAALVEPDGETSLIQQ